jgi:hypothetical protein
VFGTAWGDTDGAAEPHTIVGTAAIEMTMNVHGHVNVDTQRIALDRLDDELSG